MPDEAQTPQGVQLHQGILHMVLAEFPLAGFSRGAHRLGGLGLAHREHPHLPGWPMVAALQDRDSVPSFFQ